MSSIRSENIDSLLGALGEQLHALEVRYELVVVGGSALLSLDLVSRATKDVDVVALLRGGKLEAAEPLPDPIVEARRLVARDFGLTEDWLNTGPARLLDFGLPDGFEQRATRRPYGHALTVWMASRFDQIHFKLFATVDQGPGRHEADLRALDPTGEELLAAARWSRGHDPSEGYLNELVAVLAAFGVKDAAERA